eukprot:scaffold1272_cov250-Pinguiococcus_pyrenoidosus.AAC.58
MSPGPASRVFWCGTPSRSQVGHSTPVHYCGTLDFFGAGEAAGRLNLDTTLACACISSAEASYVLYFFVGILFDDVDFVFDLVFRGGPLGGTDLLVLRLDGVPETRIGGSFAQEDHLRKVPKEAADGDSETTRQSVGIYTGEVLLSSAVRQGHGYPHEEELHDGMRSIGLQAFQGQRWHRAKVGELLSQPERHGNEVDILVPSGEPLRAIPDATRLVLRRREGKMSRREDRKRQQGGSCCSPFPLFLVVAENRQEVPQPLHLRNGRTCLGKVCVAVDDNLRSAFRCSAHGDVPPLWPFYRSGIRSPTCVRVVGVILPASLSSRRHVIAIVALFAGFARLLCLPCCGLGAEVSVECRMHLPLRVATFELLRLLRRIVVRLRSPAQPSLGPKGRAGRSSRRRGFRMLVLLIPGLELCFRLLVEMDSIRRSSVRPCGHPIACLSLALHPARGRAGRADRYACWKGSRIRLGLATLRREGTHPVGVLDDLLNVGPLAGVRLNHGVDEAPQLIGVPVGQRQVVSAGDLLEQGVQVQALALEGRLEHRQLVKQAT